MSSMPVSSEQPIITRRPWRRGRFNSRNMRIRYRPITGGAFVVADAAAEKEVALARAGIGGIGPLFALGNDVQVRDDANAIFSIAVYGAAAIAAWSSIANPISRARARAKSSIWAAFRAKGRAFGRQVGAADRANAGKKPERRRSFPPRVSRSHCAVFWRNDEHIHSSLSSKVFFVCFHYTCPRAGCNCFFARIYAMMSGNGGVLHEENRYFLLRRFWFASARGGGAARHDGIARGLFLGG